MQQDTRFKKSVDLLYTNDKEAEKKIRETSPFTIAIDNKISCVNTNEKSERPI